MENKIEKRLVVCAKSNNALMVTIDFEDTNFSSMQSEIEKIVDKYYPHTFHINNRYYLN